MKKVVISMLLVSLILLEAKSLQQMMRESQPAKSSYIGKRFMKFEMDAGSAIRREKLPNGNTLHYYKSDAMGFSTTRGGDDQATRCILIILTDKKDIIKKIKIYERGIACGPILK